MPELTKAVIDREEHRTTIHVGNLSIEINKEPQQDGPLGMEEYSGRSPGIIFWENEHVITDLNKGFLEYGGGPCITSTAMDKYDIERVLENLDKDSKTAEGGSSE